MLKWLTLTSILFQRERKHERAYRFNASTLHDLTVPKS